MSSELDPTISSAIEAQLVIDHGAGRKSLNPAFSEADSFLGPLLYEHFKTTWALDLFAYIDGACEAFLDWLTIQTDPPTEQDVGYVVAYASALRSLTNNQIIAPQERLQHLNRLNDSLNRLPHTVPSSASPANSL